MALLSPACFVSLSHNEYNGPEHPPAHQAQAVRTLGLGGGAGGESLDTSGLQKILFVNHAFLSERCTKNGWTYGQMEGGTNMDEQTDKWRNKQMYGELMNKQ